MPQGSWLNSLSVVRGWPWIAVIQHFTLQGLAGTYALSPCHDFKNLSWASVFLGPPFQRPAPSVSRHGAQSSCSETPAIVFLYE